MQKYYLSFILFICTIMLCAQNIPHYINFKSVAKVENKILENKEITVEINVIDSIENKVVYKERHKTFTDNQGLYLLSIGKGEKEDEYYFNKINWNRKLYLEASVINTLSKKGSDSYIQGTTEFSSVPYAIMAESVTNGIDVVDNLVSLRSHPYEQDKLVYVKGHTSVADGGGGFFIYKSNISLIDDDGIIIKPNANITNKGKWLRQFDGNISILYYGARRGSNSSDKINKAIEYAAKNSSYIHDDENLRLLKGNTVFIPNGEFYIDKQIILKNGVNIEGEVNTLLTTATNSNYDYMFYASDGAMKIFINNLKLDLRNIPNVSGFHIKATKKDEHGGGLWNSSIKNIDIVNLKGNGIYLEGGEYIKDQEDTNYMQPNQFLIFENVRVLRDSEQHYALKTKGQLGQVTFINCTFDGTNIKGINAEINGGAVISFINSSFQSSEYGLVLNNTENITIDNCWFENLEIAININNGKAISVINNHFANAAGYGSITEVDKIPLNLNPQGTGRCINISNDSFVNVYNNFVNVTSDVPTPQTYGEKFITGYGSNVINAYNNKFKFLELGETYGIFQVSTITDKILNSDSKKIVFIQSSGDLYTINSLINAGEVLYLRANNGPIVIHQYKGSKGNIYLTGSATRILNLGQIASFIKIDNNDNGQTSTYQLLSISN